MWPKAWRWVGEMDEIAAAFAVHGLPDGFHRAARETYAELALRPAGAESAIDDAIDALLRR